MENVIHNERQFRGDLWLRLGLELAGVLDAHGVCATVVREIAKCFDCKALIALGDPVSKIVNVWISNESKELKQLGWPQGSDFMNYFEKGAGIIRFGIVEANLPITEDVEADFLSGQLTGIALPFPHNSPSLIPIGCLCLIEPPDNVSHDEVALLSVAASVTTYIDRALLRQRYDQQAVEYDMVSHISESISSTLIHDEIIMTVGDSARRALGVERISIAIVDQEEKELIFFEPLLDPAIGEKPSLRLKLGQGIAGWVALSGSPTIVADTSADNRFYSEVDKRSGFKTRSVLCVPLRVEEQTIGVIEALNKINGEFDGNDLRMLQAISGPLAIAIANARLHGDVLSEKLRVEALFQSMSEGMVTVSTNGIVTAANDAMATLVRADLPALVGRDVNEVVPVQSDVFRRFFAELNQGDSESAQIACDLVLGDELHIPVLVSGTVIRGNIGQILELIFVFSDLRQVHELERIREDFFSNVIHELHTPLASILLYARLIREAKGDSGKSERFLGVIERESYRLQKMIRQMLRIARLDVSEFQRSSDHADINRIIGELLPSFSARASEKGLILKHNVEKELPPVRGSDEIIQIIVSNLLENSIKFTLSGTIRFDVKHYEDHVAIRMQDEGIGIPEEAIPNLFKRFFRAQSAVERGIAGTGLGLYMVKESLDRLGGEIDVSSELGKGTTFTVTLPLAAL